MKKDFGDSNISNLKRKGKRKKGKRKKGGDESGEITQK